MQTFPKLAKASSATGVHHEKFNPSNFRLQHLAQMMSHNQNSGSRIEDFACQSPQALRETPHNLGVHQIDAEMQNEKLRRTQASLGTTQTRFFDFFDLAPVGYVTVNDQSLILQANLTLASLLDLPRADLIGQALPGFMPGLDADLYCLLCQRALASGSAQNTDLRMQQPGGLPFWVNLQAITATDEEGTAVIRMVVRDISERKQVEAQDLTNKKFRESILDSIPAQIAVLDPTGTIVAVNQGWRNRARDNSQTPGDLPIQTFVGINYLDICQASIGGGTGDSAKLARDGIVSVMNGRAPSFQLDYPCHSPTQERWSSLVVTPLNLDNLAVVVAHIDITQRRQLEQAAIEASEEKFKLVADNTSDGIVIFGADHRIQYVSPAYLQQLGYSEAEERNRSPDQIYALIHPEDRDALFARIEQAIASKASDLLYSYRIRHRLGHTIWREDHARFQYDGAGNYGGTCVVARDITERKQAEEALQHTQALLADAEKLGQVGGWEIDVQTLQTTWTKGVYDIYELDSNDRLTVDEGINYYTPASQPIIEQAVQRAIEQGEPFDLELEIISAKGNRRNVRTVGTANRARGKVSGFFQDITEHKRVEAKVQEMNRNLTESRRQLRQLSALNETRLEKEKRHIAREVHDELGQILTALRMDLSLAIIRHAGHVPDLVGALNGMKMQVDLAIQGVRNVANSLRPAALDMGLVTALEWLCREFTKHGAVECALLGCDERVAIDDDRAVVIFRIVQEALTNIRKYAQASQVDITLERREAELSVEVRDNGLGFDPVAVAQRGTLGLLGMRERVIALGGRVEVVSTPGQGTVIGLVIPLETEVAKAPA